MVWPIEQKMLLFDIIIDFRENRPGPTRPDRSGKPQAWLAKWLAHQTRTQIAQGSIPVAGKISLLSKDC